MTAVFRPRFGRGLTVAVAVLALGSVVVVGLDDVGAALRYGPAFALGATLVWALFGRPAVLVDDGGVELRNVVRTIRLPWPSIERIDTKYALTLYTAYGVFTAWAAPAPSRSQTLGAARADTRHLPESSYIGGGIRPGDLAGTASGDPAAYIRRHMDELREAGHLDDPRLEAPRPHVQWHVLPLAGVLALAALAVTALRW